MGRCQRHNRRTGRRPFGSVINPNNGMWIEHLPICARAPISHGCECFRVIQTVAVKQATGLFPPTLPNIQATIGAEILN